jgi:hypothetical protein
MTDVFTILPPSAILPRTMKISNSQRQPRDTLMTRHAVLKPILEPPFHITVSPSRAFQVLPSHWQDCIVVTRDHKLRRSIPVWAIMRQGNCEENLWHSSVLRWLVKPALYILPKWKEKQNQHEMRWK